MAWRDTPPDEEAYMSGSDSDGDEDVAGTGILMELL